MIDLPLGTAIRATVGGRVMLGYWAGGRDAGQIETIVVAGNGGEFIADPGSIEELKESRTTTSPLSEEGE